MLKRDTPGVTEVDLNQLIRSVERIAHSDAKLHNVTVQLDLSPGVPPVKGDTVQLQQVMLNLMLNAFSAMSGTGLDGARRLIVRTNSIDGSNVLVEVQDSGTGIAADKLECDLRSLHHQQAGRTRNGPFDLSLHHRTPRRKDMGCKQSRPWRDVLDHAAGHPRVKTDRATRWRFCRMLHPQHVAIALQFIRYTTISGW